MSYCILYVLFNQSGNGKNRIATNYFNHYPTYKSLNEVQISSNPTTELLSFPCHGSANGEPAYLSLRIVSKNVNKKDSERSLQKILESSSQHPQELPSEK